MAKTVNRKNNCTVHFMVNEEDMKELNRRFAMTNFKSKREFYRDSIFKNRIISVDLSGEFRKELRELSSLISRNSANLNQISKAVNSQALFTKMILKVSRKPCRENYVSYRNLEKKYRIILSIR